MYMSCAYPQVESFSPKRDVSCRFHAPLIVLLPISHCGCLRSPRTEVNVRLILFSTSSALDARHTVLKIPSQNVPFPSTFLLPPLEKILALVSYCYELRCLPCAPTENNGRWECYRHSLNSFKAIPIPPLLGNKVG